MFHLVLADSYRWLRARSLGRVLGHVDRGEAAFVDTYTGHLQRLLEADRLKDLGQVYMEACTMSTLLSHYAYTPALHPVLIELELTRIGPGIQRCVLNYHR